MTTHLRLPYGGSGKTVVPVPSLALQSKCNSRGISLKSNLNILMKKLVKSLDFDFLSNKLR